MRGFYVYYHGLLIPCNCRDIRDFAHWNPVVVKILLEDSSSLILLSPIVQSSALLAVAETLHYPQKGKLNEVLNYSQFIDKKYPKYN